MQNLVSLSWTESGWMLGHSALEYSCAVAERIAWWSLVTMVMKTGTKMTVTHPLWVQKTCSSHRNSGQVITTMLNITSQKSRTSNNSNKIKRKQKTDRHMPNKQPKWPVMNKIILPTFRELFSNVSCSLVQAVTCFIWLILLSGQFVFWPVCLQAQWPDSGILQTSGWLVSVCLSFSMSVCMSVSVKCLYLCM